MDGSNEFLPISRGLQTFMFPYDLNFDEFMNHKKYFLLPLATFTAHKALKGFFFDLTKT